MPCSINNEVYDAIISRLDSEKALAEQLNGRYNVSYYKGIVEGITFMMELLGYVKHADIIERHYRGALDNVNRET